MRFGPNHVTAVGRKIKINEIAIPDDENHIHEGKK